MTSVFTVEVQVTLCLSSSQLVFHKGFSQSEHDYQYCHFLFKLFNFDVKTSKLWLIFVEGNCLLKILQ
jgi:hypothetical protein